MTDTLRIKRRTSPAGAPSALANAEIAFNEASGILYYGSGGTPAAAASIIAIGGSGAFLPLSGGTLSGNLTVTGTVQANTTGGTQQALMLAGGGTTSYLFAIPNVGNGAYNALNLAGDMSLLVSTGSVNTGNLVIGPWSSGTIGIRISAPANTITFRGASTFGEAVTFNNGISFGSQIAASTTDLSKHIALWGTGYGFSITAGSLNLVSNGAVPLQLGNTSAVFNVAVTAPTPAVLDNSTKVATTAYVIGSTANYTRINTDVSFDLDTITGTAAKQPYTAYVGLHGVTNQAAGLNFPTGVNTGFILSGFNSNAGWNSQLFMGANALMWYRSSTGQGTYSPWYKVLSEVGGTFAGNFTLSGNLTVASGTTTLGTATATTPAAADNSTNIATTAFVANAVSGGVGGYLPLSGGSLTGGLGFGSTVAPGGATDLSRHIALYSTTYGINVTSGPSQINYVVPAGAAHNFVLGTVTIANIGSNVTLLGAGTGAQTVAICGAAANGRWLEWRSGTTGATMRWRFATTAAAESGSNAGSDFQLIRGSDTGTSLGTPITITRSTGAMTIGEAIGTVTFPGPVYIGNQLVAFGGEADEIPLNSNLGSAAYADLNNHILANYVFTHNAAYQVLSTDWTNLLLMTTGTNTWTLPASGDVITGWWAYFKNRATTNLTIALTGTDTLNGVAASQVIPGGTSGRLFKSGTGAYESIVIPGQSTTTPLMDGTAAIGTSLTYAAADHVHPSDTSRFAVAGGTVTGATTFSAAVTHNSQINFGSTAVASATDLSRHIALYSTSFGFSITGGTLNLVSNGGVHAFAGNNYTCPGTIVSNNGATFNGGTTTINGPAVVQNNNLYVQNTAGYTTMCMVKSASGQGNQILGYTTTSAASGLRWNIQLGDATAESGSNAGSNFSISRYTDAGAYIDSPFQINRSTGTIFFTNAVLWTTDSIFGFTISGASRLMSFAQTAGGSNSLQCDTSGLALYVWVNGRNLWAMRNSDGLAWNPTGTVGGNGAYTNISDLRMKTDVTDADVGLAEIERLRPVRFRRVTSDRTEIGFVAQDVAKVLPEAVTTLGIELPDGSGGLDSDEPSLGMSNDAIIAALVNSVRQLSAEMRELKARH